MKRRGFLGMVSITGIASLTGCLGGKQQADSISSIQIPEIRLYNWTQNNADIDVVVTEGSDVSSWKSFPVEESSEKIISKTPDEPGTYSILANPPAGTPRKITAAWVLDTADVDVENPPRVAIEFDLRADGTFSRDFEIMD